MISLATNANDDNGNYEKLDFSKCRFPSDGLTVGVLRTVHAELFDKGFSGVSELAQPQFFLASQNAGHAEDVVGNMLFIERFIATVAYADTRGLPRPRGDVADYTKELIALYERYGLAKGAHHATELIRSLAQQGVNMAHEQSR